VIPVDVLAADVLHGGHDGLRILAEQALEGDGQFVVARVVGQDVARQGPPQATDDVCALAAPGERVVAQVKDIG
jgi:hypothetical protein